MKVSTWLMAFATLLCLSTNLPAQNVFIPDANFKSVLINNPQINTNGDGEIQTSEASAFTGTIDAQNRNIGDITGIEAFTAVKRLYVNNNLIASADLSANTELVILRLNHNQLTGIDLSGNAKLTQLHIYSNQLAALDISALAALEILYAFQNKLVSVNTQANTQLREVNLAFNMLKELDLSGNPLLKYVDVKQNVLKHLSVHNGNNTSITYFNALRNVDLLCIEVDDPSYSEQNWNNVEPGSQFSQDCSGEGTNIVFIPDAAFKAVLVANKNININGDTEIQYLEANNYTGSIFAPEKHISELTGLEAFTSLTELHVYGNDISSIDLRFNGQLRVLRIDHNPISSLNPGSLPHLTTLLAHSTSLTALDVSANAELATLWCFDSQLTSLDVSGNGALADLQVNHNQLTSLTFGSHPNLKKVLAYQNKLASLNISGATAIEELRLQQNKLTGIDLHSHSSLRDLNVGDNMLTSLDLTGKPGLRSVWCYNNLIGNLDISTNPNILSFRAYKNKLTVLNVKNGNNTRLSDFDVMRNPALQCIQVDDPAWSNANWPKKDPTAEYKSDCGYGGPAVVNIPDANFRARLIELGVDTNHDSQIQYSEAEAFTAEMMLVGAGIKDPTGVEAFTGVTRMIWEHNDITALDVTQCVSLKYLSSGYTQVNYLQINDGLEVLECYSSPLTSLHFPNNNSLTYIDFSETKIGSFDLDEYQFASKLKFFAGSSDQLLFLDLTSAVNLEFFGLGNTPLMTIDLSASSKLTALRMNGNLRLEFLDISNGNNTNITEFSLQNHPKLTCIEVDDAEYAQSHFTVESHTHFSEDCDGSETYVNIPDANFKHAVVSNPNINTNGDGEITEVEARNYSGMLNLFDLNISDLTGIEAFMNIEALDVSENNLSKLFLQNHGRLRWLFANNNQISALAIYECDALGEVEVNGNQLGSLIMPRLIKEMYAANNLIATVSWTAAPTLVVGDFHNNKLTEIDLVQNTALRDLNVSNNSLTWLNIPNAGTDGLFELNALNNDLTCIQVNDPAYAEANWRDTVDPEASFNTHCEGDPGIVYIPDPNLKRILVGLVDGNNDNQVKDGEVQYYEAINYYGLLDITSNDDNPDNDIVDVTGIGAFGNVEALDCSYNKITRFDEPMNITDFVANNNEITEVTVDMSNVYRFMANNNRLTRLPHLKYVAEIHVGNNQLTVIDNISPDNYLGYINATTNKITEFSFRGFAGISELFIGGNELTSLDITENNGAINKLNVSNNHLTSLNLKNGKNDQIEFFEAVNNPDLLCIQVDDAAVAESEWRDSVDPQASFSEDCSAGSGLRVAVSPNPTMGKVLIESNRDIDEVQIFDGISGGFVSSGQGTEVDMSHLRNGLYFLKIKSGNNISTTRIVKK